MSQQINSVIEARERRRWLLDGAVVLLALILLRVAMLAALSRATHGHEFTGDSLMFAAMGSSPGAILSGGGDREYVAQFPPLEPFFISVFYLPLIRVFPLFVALRAVFLIYDVLTFVFFWLALWHVPDRNARWRRILGMAFILVPVGWMTSIVMVQDEVIGGMFLTAVAWLVLSRRPLAAVFVCGAAVVCAKIFFLVPLLVLVAGPPLRGIVMRGLLSGVCIVPVYGLVAYHRARQGMGMALSDFAPGVDFGITFWTPLLHATGLDPMIARRLSGLLALLASLALFGGARRRQGLDEPLRLLRVSLAMLLAVFLLFYHVDPEYYFLISAAILLTFPRGLALFTTVFAFSLAWGINFFYGVANAVEHGATPASNVFVKLFYAIFPPHPRALQSVTLWLFNAINLILVILFARLVLRSAQKALAPSHSNALPRADVAGIGAE